jgi:hypothetical protein
VSIVSKLTQSTMKKFLWLIIMTMGVVSILKAQTSTEIEPKGVYKEIDVERHNNAIRILNSKNKNSIQHTVIAF